MAIVKMKKLRVIAVAGRRQELARLTGGSMITETTLAGAAELLRLAEQTKRGVSHENS